MLPDRASNPGPLIYESGALPIALRGPAFQFDTKHGYLSKLTPMTPMGDRVRMTDRPALLEWIPFLIVKNYSKF